MNDAPPKEKGPGKSFRKVFYLMDLFKLFPDDDTAAQWFAAQRWPDGKPICPACGHHDVQVGAAHANQPY